MRDKDDIHHLPGEHLYFALASIQRARFHFQFQLRFSRKNFRLATMHSVSVHCFCLARATVFAGEIFEQIMVTLTEREEQQPQNFNIDFLAIRDENGLTKWFGSVDGLVFYRTVTVYASYQLTWFG